MSDSDISGSGDAPEQASELTQAQKEPLATSYLPLWFLLAFAAVIVYGLLTK